MTRREHRLPASVRRVVVVLTAAAIGVVLAAPAWGHSFLATTSPVQGERLAAPPDEVALQLSEPVERETVRLEVTDGSGTPVEVGRLAFDNDDAVVRLPLVEPATGLYRISWHVVSAVDGHESAGEFAFAVGDDVDLEAATAAGGPAGPTPGTTAGTWLLLVGWSIAFGAATLAGRTDRDTVPGGPVTWVRGGVLAALLGIGIRSLLATGAQTALVGLVAALLLLLSLALSTLRTRWPSLAALGAFAALWPLRGHAAATPLGWLLDAVHLAAAGVWAGGLTVVVVALARAVRAGAPGRAVPLVRSYARVAVAAVIALLATGVLLGVTLVPSPAALVEDGYGRLVLVKAGLLAVAVAAAVVARRRLASSGTDGLLPAVRVEHVVLGAALLVAAILSGTSPTPTTVDTLLGPPPIRGPVARAAGLAGQITLDVQAGDGRLDVQARAGSGGLDAEVSVAATLPDGTGLELAPRPCGTGCSTLGLELPDGVTRLTATATAEDRAGGTTEMLLRWPPPAEQPRLFEQMRTALRSAEAVVVAEQFDTDPAAPAADGPRLTGDELVRLMPWAGGGVSDVRPVGDTPDRFTFYLPGSHMWFDLTVDELHRPVRQRLVNAGHDIRYRFAYPPASQQ